MPPKSKRTSDVFDDEDNASSPEAHHLRRRSQRVSQDTTASKKSKVARSGQKREKQNKTISNAELVRLEKQANELKKLIAQQKQAAATQLDDEDGDEEEDNKFDDDDDDDNSKDMEVEVESEDEPGFTMAGADDDTIRFAAVSTITPMRTITTSAPPHIDLTRIRRKNGKIVPITPRNAYMSVPSSGNGSEHEEPNHSQEETTAANIITPTISRQAGPIQLFQTNNASQQSSATVTDATDTTVTTINNANSGSADSTGQRSTLSFSSDYKPGGKPKAEDYDSEGKAILVRACAYYEAKVLGVKGFPDSSTQIGWARKAFRDACRVAEKDYECDKRIERLLKGRGSRIRGDMLRFVEEAVMSTFGFTKDTSKKAKRQNLELYDALSDDMRFAFKDTTNCTGFAENPVFQLILRLACFGQGHDSPGIVFARFFDPVSLETLALFMTQIHHIMRQWSTGIYIRHGKTNPFSETGYTAIHKKHLHELQLWQELNEYVVTQIRKRMYTRARAKSGIDPPKIKSLITGELQDKIAQELAGRTGDTESEREDDENEEEEEGGQVLQQGQAGDGPGE
ncbi:hypothetical protein D9758_004948 [Tetrapyrgos nigripes]|uniref:DUF6532 domain-containing protein n=1 Tax=Tetrapyrgos nigripes TaxID=182062 RepID=A0A8H5LWG1_9AGAR|nr:hypothetical protein D9758_013075 [Tetrapyrgos nigripes]KAF5372083.1 hypothetical protein D9758_004948 [Tetrapyrgos nigripes]